MRTERGPPKERDPHHMRTKTLPKGPDQIGIHLKQNKGEILQPPKKKTDQENSGTAQTKTSHKWLKHQKRKLIKSIQERQKLAKLETRRCEKSGQESAQNKGSEVKTPKISPFRAVNEGNSDKKDEQSMGEISPLWKDSMPLLYNDSVQPGPSAQADRRNEHAEDGGEEEEEEEVEVFYEKPEVVQIDSEIHSELDSDDNEVDYSIALEYRQEEMDRKKRNEEHNTVQIKIEPRGDLGEEEEELFDYEEDQEADGGESEVESVEESLKRRVLTRNMATVSRNRRRSTRWKIERDQRTVPAHLRLGDGTDKYVYGRSRTPSTEIMSENEVIRRTVRNIKREPEGATEEDGADKPSDRGRRVYKKGNKPPKNKNYRRK